MRKSKTLARVRAGEPAAIACLGHFIPAYVRHAAAANFDCIWLDLEHRCWEPREVQSILAFFHYFDIDCLLRCPTREHAQLYRYLEDGAAGLMIPHVTTREDAENLARFTRFPPIGNRGLDGAGLDVEFDVQKGAEYTDAANRETMLVVQIESPEAVGNADEIASVEGVDGLFIGPGDLGLRLRYDDSGLDLAGAEERVSAACQKHGKAWGRPAFNNEDLNALNAKGAQLLAYGGEFRFILDGLNRCGAELDALRQS